jgi:hypothetical protein
MYLGSTCYGQVLVEHVVEPASSPDRGGDRIGQQTDSSRQPRRGLGAWTAARAPHSRAVGGGTPQTCPGSAPRRPAHLRIEQGVCRGRPGGEGRGGCTGGAVAEAAGSRRLPRRSPPPTAHLSLLWAASRGTPHIGRTGVHSFGYPRLITALIEAGSSRQVSACWPICTTRIWLAEFC